MFYIQANTHKHENGGILLKRKEKKGFNEQKIAFNYLLLPKTTIARTIIYNYCLY